MIRGAVEEPTAAAKGAMEREPYFIVENDLYCYTSTTKRQRESMRPPRFSQVSNASVRSPLSGTVSPATPLLMLLVRQRRHGVVRVSELKVLEPPLRKILTQPRCRMEATSRYLSRR